MAKKPVLIEEAPVVEAVAEATAPEAAAEATELSGLAAELAEAEQTPVEAQKPDVKCRVLAPCGYGKPNDVVTVSAEAAEIGLQSGELDPDPAAVGYAESL